MAPATASDSHDRQQVGPHPSYIELAKPYIFQSKIHECLTKASITEAKDDGIRLQGVSWIDSVRKFMHLPVRTYNTAVVHYHKFRFAHPEANGYIVSERENEHSPVISLLKDKKDAAAAALFTACKLEDTLKKSKEILCAAYNMKLPPGEHLTPDDPMFEQHSKTIIGLERLMLEASGFDFRNRYPQKILLKLVRHNMLDQETVGKTAYNMSLDLYRTYAPLRQTAATMALSCVELAQRLWDQNVGEAETQTSYQRLWTTRAEVMETLLDLLDLYTHHRTSTIVGPQHTLEKFIDIRITLNQEASAKQFARYTRSERNIIINDIKMTNGMKEKSSKKATRTKAGSDETTVTDSKLSSNNGSNYLPKPGLKDGTVRFMLDPQRAKEEKSTVFDFFNLEEEEYEYEIPFETAAKGERRRP